MQISQILFWVSAGSRLTVMGILKLNLVTSYDGLIITKIVMCSSSELQTLCIKFQSELRTWFNIAHSLVAIADLGYDKIEEQIVIDDIDYTFSVPITTTFGISFATLNKLPYSKILGIYLEHKQAIVELVFGRIVQIWYDFLNRMYEQILKETFAGVKTYTGIQDLVNGKNVEDIDKMVKEFDLRTGGVRKIEKMETYLDKKIDDDYKQRITVCITVRNLLEHNQGFIRQSDLDNLESQSIKLINLSFQEQDFLVSERVEITIYELFRLKQCFYYASKQLIFD